MRTLPRISALVAITALALAGCADGATQTQESTSSASSTAAPEATPTPSATQPSALSCPDEPRPIDQTRIEQTLAFARQQLERAAGDQSGYPIGALKDASTYDRTNAKRWTAGFFPAELWLMARSGDEQWREKAEQWSSDIPNNAQRTDTHDLGFLVGLPMEQAAKADPTNADQYKEVANTAARSLAQRWNPTVGAIQSGQYDGQWGVIVDSAMNMPLLLEAGQRIGGAEGDDLIAKGTRHLQFLIREFIREDGTAIHRQVFDSTTGANLGPVEGQGEGPNSTWARGQAWAIHGFTDGYRLTQNPEFLDAAERTAQAYIDRVPAGCIPTWDLDLTEGPESTPLDSSAAAITANALLTLAEVEPDPSKATQYRDYALITLNTLTNERSLAQGTSNPGILLRQTYNVNENPESGSYVWGDTYLLLALIKAQSLGG